MGSTVADARARARYCGACMSLVLVCGCSWIQGGSHMCILRGSLAHLAHLRLKATARPPGARSTSLVLQVAGVATLSGELALLRWMRLSTAPQSMDALATKPCLTGWPAMEQTICA